MEDGHRATIVSIISSDSLKVVRWAGDSEPKGWLLLLRDENSREMRCWIWNQDSTKIAVGDVVVKTNNGLLKFPKP